ncbi:MULTISPECIES: hypothetical protein [Sphingobacterium]|jgi:hypothetical protein|uniref:hypothetical protein n=1 Tax=Sphingobacterium sp. IITKGP-BTPF85 TaxID=1338009 RepID=UPI00038A34D4|nr:hypothetical protein [Sphingobacterium sp. IITKGP-BTPF85]KKX47331.1 hypothetical protein L950_0227010 [Sphingobacterium sp. IITKGP-BTPF85]
MSIDQLFDHANTRYVIKQLNTINGSLSKIKRTIDHDIMRLHFFKSVDEITRRAFVRDDSALLFSETRNSLDISIDHLLDYLVGRMLTELNEEILTHED